MEILITNDDGYQARGIALLARLMRQIGNVTVVAPDRGQSGQSNAITIGRPNRMWEISQEDGVRVFATTGTPTDCVKIALNTLFRGTRPDLLVAGINHGSNTSVNVLYSGTMGAVITGCEAGIPSIGFSLNDHSAKADFSYFEPHIVPLTQKILALYAQQAVLPDRVCWNINAPVGEIAGISLTRQCRGHWQDDIVEQADPYGQPTYWLGGHFVSHEPEATDTDDYAIAHQQIAVTPTTIDMTWKDTTAIGLAF